MTKDKLIKKVLLPIGVFALFYVAAQIIKSNPPESKRGRPSMAPQLYVDVQEIKPKAFTVNVESYGTVKPRTQSNLLPQVSGQIVAINEAFRDGGFFEKGEVLVELDDRDLKAEIKVAQANLFNAQHALSEEVARGEQAKQDWDRLGNGREASDLVLRKPQLLSAKAKVLSAEAQLDKANLALERSKIKAPFTGRILKKDVDVGQVVSPNTRLAQMYAIDYVEVRLPIKNRDLIYLALPETNRTNESTLNENLNVTFSSDLAGIQTWQGKIVRTEGAFDSDAQQLFVVAQITDPYKHVSAKQLPIKIGQYVSAEITGKTLNNAIVIPNKSIYQGTYVYIVEDGVLKRKDITLAWQNEEIAMLESGLTTGQQLVLTPLGQVTSGTRVALNSKDGETVAKQSKKPRKRMTPEEFAKLPKEQQDAIKARRAKMREQRGAN